ncbi:MAG TPA: NAD(P)/FAD-dependent oxidoreductase [Anaerolineae bacterium]|nr:NAD(P)/FAD-dependent oxidoreductase [Anaerolineae bacterium]
MSNYDGVIVGSGPNGLAAAIRLAQAGKRVVVYEANSTIGGGSRSAELTLPGFIHDTCSSIHPLGIGSPFFKTLPLNQYGLEWIQPSAPLAHVWEDGTAVMLEDTVDATARGLGRDGARWAQVFGPLAARWNSLAPMILGPLVRFPRNPFLLGYFGAWGVWSAKFFARRLFREEKTRGLFGGLAAHAILELETPLTASFGMVLGLTAQTVGWPLPRGGSQKIADALACYLKSLGGEIVTNTRVENVNALPKANAFLFDVTPRQLLDIASDHFTARYRRQLQDFRYGPGVFKLDYALDGPIPWKAKEALRAGTVHIGGMLEEISASERAVWRGEPSEHPYVLVVQTSLFDNTRAPEGKHTLWAYCHVPNGSSVDMTERIENQIERFAPGFKNRILARSTMSPAQIEARNANYIGGDINGGVQDFFQLFGRPVWRANPYTTSDKSIYICSSSTPPGGGVHGMCGFHAANAALKWAWGVASGLSR